MLEETSGYVCCNDLCKIVLGNWLVCKIDVIYVQTWCWYSKITPHWPISRDYRKRQCWWGFCGKNQVSEKWNTPKSGTASSGKFSCTQVCGCNACCSWPWLWLVSGHPTYSPDLPTVAITDSGAFSWWSSSPFISYPDCFDKFFTQLPQQSCLFKSPGLLSNVIHRRRNNVVGLRKDQFNIGLCLVLLRLS